MSENGLHSGHRERLRQRYLENGTENLCEHEFLELLLFYALPRINTNEISHLLTDRFGSLKNVLDAPVEQLTEVKGIGKTAAGFLKLMGELRKDSGYSGKDALHLSTYELASQWFLDYFKGNNSELYLIIGTTSGIRPQVRFSFTPDMIRNHQLDLKKIALMLLKSGSERMFLGINHPSDDFYPIERDYLITRNIADAIEPIGIYLTDTMICKGEKIFSFRQNGSFSFREMR